MGEATKGPIRLDFDRRLNLEFWGATITSDAGVFAFRELNETLGLSQMAAQKLDESRLARISSTKSRPFFGKRSLEDSLDMKM